LSIHLTVIKPKKRYARCNVPHSNNPVFMEHTNQICIFCNKSQRRQYHNLYQLHYHLIQNHRGEYGTKSWVMDLADKILQGEKL
jgi:hypothetical protein